MGYGKRPEVYRVQEVALSSKTGGTEMPGKRRGWNWLRSDTGQNSSDQLATTYRLMEKTPLKKEVSPDNKPWISVTHYMSRNNAIF